MYPNQQRNLADNGNEFKNKLDMHFQDDIYMRKDMHQKKVWFRSSESQEKAYPNSPPNLQIQP